MLINEWFGYRVNRVEPEIERLRSSETCPILGAPCEKKIRGQASGVCSMSTTGGVAVCTCPVRMYSNGYQLLADVATVAFGEGARVMHPSSIHLARRDGLDVVAFGKRYGRELRLPGRGGRQSYFIDWILARLDEDGKLLDFAALEVQTIDTTGNYRDALDLLRQGDRSDFEARAGFNWENVSKRILPQLIYKGHVLRRERLCPTGLYFACPTAVYNRVQQRLGGGMHEQFRSQGTITFLWYDLEDNLGLRQVGSFTTTVDQLALAFTSPTNLPESGVYQAAIEHALSSLAPSPRADEV
jgi:hypothetical protein